MYNFHHENKAFKKETQIIASNDDSVSASVRMRG